jgi:hypothetical protein
MDWDRRDDTIALLCIASLVVGLLAIRACIPPEWHHPAERPATPPESLYEPGG